MEWMSIDTAPKDGTIILLAGGQDDNADYSADPAMAALMRAPCRAMWTGDFWLIALAEACYVGVGRENPTHWMPLPEPPK